MSTNLQTVKSHTQSSGAVSVGTTATLIIAGNPKRMRLVLSVPSSAGASVWIGKTSSVTVANGTEIQAGASATAFGEGMWMGSWYGIVASGSESVRNMENTTAATVPL